jgi:predicted homoserine dehydrogenase-like protein
MNYTKLFQTSTPIKVSLIGTGAFGKSLLWQSQAIAPIQMAVVCDKSVDIARQACLEAGLLPEQLLACENTSQVLTALESGKMALIEDATLMMDTSLDVVVEATGMPEAGAKHAKQALEHDQACYQHQQRGGLCGRANFEQNGRPAESGLYPRGWRPAQHVNQLD